MKFRWKQYGKGKRRKAEVKEKEWWMRFYPAAEKLLDFVDGFRTTQNREKEQQRFRELYMTADYRERGRKEQIKQIAITIVFVLLVFVMAALSEIKTLSSQVGIRNNRIYRRSDVPQVELNWSAGEENGSIAFELIPQRIPTEGRDKLFQEAENYIRSCIQGGNESLRALRGDIMFPESVPGTEITVECRPGSYHWLNADGSRTLHALPEEGAEELLEVTMCYYEEEREFVLELWLLPEGSEEERFQKRLETELLYLVADNTGEYISLPEQINGIPVAWSVKRENTAVTFLFLGLVATICIPLAGKRKQEEQVKKREQELMTDYPELVSKYLLLLNAGLSQRSVWERIVSDYRKSGRKRYVYEEMQLTMREMENGIPEGKAYERFGKRCRLLPYMRFSGVLVQNLQKGARGSLLLLEQEALAAFAERKEAAKRKGEEAGTKLLLPMFGLLGIVLVLVMFPAFWKL